jgi:uncharacterized protein
MVHASSGESSGAFRFLAPVRGRKAYSRELAPDVARGMALCFIAVANVMLYLHGRPYGMRQHLLEDGAADRIVTFTTVAVVDGRVYPLFALLLGYGIARLYLGDSGGQGIRRIRRRGIGLILFGAVHGILLFSGDILGLYGLVTLALIPVLRWPQRRLLFSAALMLVPVALVQGVALAGPGPTMQRMVLWSIGISDPVEALAWRPLEWVMGMAGMLGVVPAVLVGIAAGRADLLTSLAERRRLLTYTGIGGVAIGLLGGIPAATVSSGLLQIPPGLGAIAISTLHVATGVLGGIGYAALMSLLCSRPSFGRTRIAHLLTAVGERSLTCYLLQTVFMVPPLTAWTLGWGGRIGSAQAMVLAIAIYAITAVAALWMRHHDIRPAEQLLRRFADAPPSP